MACECIPELRRWYREDVENAFPSCPRMCKQRWKHTGMKGYPFEEINESLGVTKEIESILQPSDGEEGMLDEILEGVELYAATDPSAQTWEKWLVENKKICWEKLFDLDVGSRDPAFVPEDEQYQESTLPPRSQRKPLNLHQVEAKLIRLLESGFASVNNKIEELESRVQSVEVVVNDSLNRGFDCGGRTGYPFHGAGTFSYRGGYEEGGTSGTAGGADTGVGVGTDTGVGVEEETGVGVVEETGVGVVEETGEEVEEETGEEVEEETGEEVEEETGEEVAEETGEEVAEETGEEGAEETGEEVEEETGEEVAEETGEEGAEETGVGVKKETEEEEEGDKEEAKTAAEEAVTGKSCTEYLNFFCGVFSVVTWGLAGTTPEEAAAEELFTLRRGRKRKTKPSRFLKTPYTRRKK